MAEGRPVVYAEILRRPEFNERCIKRNMYGLYVDESVKKTD